MLILVRPLALLVRPLVRSAPRRENGRRLSRRLRDLFWPALVLSSIVQLLGYLGLQLELPAALLASRVAHAYDAGGPAGAPDVRASLALVEIDDQTFNGRYQGKSPLDRCTLVRDLEPLLLNPAIETVAIDLFLSPGPSQDPKDLDCQQGLERLLHAHGKKIIAIVDDSDEDRVWAKRFRDVSFADPRFSAQFGLVLHHRLDREPMGLGVLVARRFCPAPAQAAAPAQPAPGFCAELPSLFGVDRKPVRKSVPIRFEDIRQLHDQGLPLRIDDTCLRPGGADCGVRHVLVGAGYSADDSHLTPVGRMSGVSVHAAIAANPLVTRSQKPGLLVDFVAGLAFGWLVATCWRKYLAQRTGRVRSASPWRGADLAYLWLCLMAAGWTVLTLGLLILSAYLYVDFGIWINAFPIGLGMALEALVTGSVRAAVELMGPRPDPVEDAGKTRRLLTGAPTAVGALLTVLALFDLAGWLP